MENQSFDTKDDAASWTQDDPGDEFTLDVVADCDVKLLDQTCPQCPGLILHMLLPISLLECRRGRAFPRGYAQIMVDRWLEQRQSNESLHPYTKSSMIEHVYFKNATGLSLIVDSRSNTDNADAWKFMREGPSSPSCTSPSSSGTKVESLQRSMFSWNFGSQSV